MADSLEKTENVGAQFLSLRQPVSPKRSPRFAEATRTARFRNVLAARLVNRALVVSAIRSLFASSFSKPLNCAVPFRGAELAGMAPDGRSHQRGRNLARVSPRHREDRTCQEGDRLHHRSRQPGSGDAWRRNGVIGASVGTVKSQCHTKLAVRSAGSGPLDL